MEAFKLLIKNVKNAEIMLGKHAEVRMVEITQLG